jgi:hypothetical protein
MTTTNRKRETAAMTDPTPPVNPTFDPATCTCPHEGIFHDTTKCRAALTDTVPTNECACTAAWKTP